MTLTCLFRSYRMEKPWGALWEFVSVRCVCVCLSYRQSLPTVWYIPLLQTLPTSYTPDLLHNLYSLTSSIFPFQSLIEHTPLGGNMFGCSVEPACTDRLTEEIKMEDIRGHLDLTSGSEDPYNNHEKICVLISVCMCVSVCLGLQHVFCLEAL